MSLFGNLFGKKPEPQKERPDGPEAFFPPAGEINLSDWDQVFSACLGKMFTVQNRLAELVKDEPSWNVAFSPWAGISSTSSFWAASPMCPNPGCGAGRM